MRKSTSQKPSRSGKKAESFSSADRVAALRIIDANANRLREGLRSVEEYVRFARDDTGLTRKLKGLRHRLKTVLDQIPEKNLLRARNSAADVGRHSIQSEQRRPCLRSVAAANWKRCQEAARVLEEYAKVMNAEAAEGFKEIRFALYTLEKQFVLKD